MFNSNELENISSYRNKYQIDIILDINGLIKIKNTKFSKMEWKIYYSRFYG